MAPTKKSGKPAGASTAYTYFVKYCREEQRKKDPDFKVDFSAFSKECGQHWATLTPDQKLYFEQQAKQDKERYNTEMENYVPPPGEKKMKKKKDVNAPKRAMSAFFWFSNEQRPVVKGQFPEYGIGDVAKVLGRQWGELSAEAKKKYQDMADKDKVRYQRQIAEYTEGNGN